MASEKKLDYDAPSNENDDVMKQLTHPHSTHEPEVGEEVLQHLDAIADSVEVQRLTKIGVLSEPMNGAKTLSARFVKTRGAAPQVLLFGFDDSMMLRMNLRSSSLTGIHYSVQRAAPLLLEFCQRCSWR